MIGQTQKHPEWRVIVDLFRAATWGDVLSHADLAAATGLAQETRPYYRQISQARRVLLREHDIEVESVPKEGYRRVEPARYGERARRETRLGRRRISRGHRVVQAAPVHLLSDEQVKELEQIMRQQAALLAHATRVIKGMRNVLPPVAPIRALPESGETH